MSLSPRLQIVARMRARGEAYRAQKASQAAWAKALAFPLLLCLPAALVAGGAAWMRAEAHRINQSIAHPITQPK